MDTNIVKLNEKARFRGLHSSHLSLPRFWRFNLHFRHNVQKFFLLSAPRNLN